MDTDELSDEAYSGIIFEAEKFLHEMTLHFGVLASRCKNEDEYIQSALMLVNSLREAKHNDYWDIFFAKTPTVKSVHNVLDKIERNIQNICKIPLTKRNFSRWGVPKYVRELKKNND
jgi:hypothetical protein